MFIFIDVRNLLVIEVCFHHIEVTSTKAAYGLLVTTRQGKNWRCCPSRVDFLVANQKKYFFMKIDCIFKSMTMTGSLGPSTKKSTQSLKSTCVTFSVTFSRFFVKLFFVRNQNNFPNDKHGSSVPSAF